MIVDILNEVNDKQRDAVCYVKGPSIILAGAGSGKTRVLTYKVIYLVNKIGVDPKTIVMVTFTNKAALEMKNRIEKFIYSPLGFIGTFHSFCARILRRDGYMIGLDKNYVIFDEEDSIKLISSILKNKKKDSVTPSYIKSCISSAKDNLICPDEYGREFFSEKTEIVADIYKEYQKLLEKQNAIDFDDLIFKTVILFRDYPEILNRYQTFFKFLLIDEFHDTNASQYILAKLLAQKNKNITVVGDFSQSIYSWRGADIKNLERFQIDFKRAKIFYLEQNYRSTQKILDFAYNVIALNQSHPILKLFTKNTEGEDVEVKRMETEQEEALFVAQKCEEIAEKNGFENIAVLYRINAQSRVIEEAFLHFGIPYVLVGGTRFYERREIKDLISYVRFFVNDKDEMSKKRLISIGKKRFELAKNVFKEIKKDKADISTFDLINVILEKCDYLSLYNEKNIEDINRLENIKELKSVAENFPNIHDFLEQIALVESEYFENEKKGKQKSGVNLMTLHSAKGLEFPFVFIVGVEEGILPHSRSFYNKLELEEERRLLYVGITRAQKKLYITWAAKRFIFGRRISCQPSRFIEEYVEDSYF